MKIQLASDLHLEFLKRDWPKERLIAPAPDADVLVLAGDIGNGTEALGLFADWPVPVLYVCGNHEFYGHPIEPERLKMKAVAPPNVHLLENELLNLGSVRFLGTTLWTDYKVIQGHLQSSLMQACEAGLNDHYQIRTGRHTFRARDALALHDKARQWMEVELAKPFDGKTVVITHHAPHPVSIHPRYLGQALTAGFVSDLSDLLPKVDLWLHGHVHDSFDYTLGRCRVVANPAGYVKNRNYMAKADAFEFENQGFCKSLVLEV